MYTTTSVTSGQTYTSAKDIVICKLDTHTGDCLWVAQQPSFNSNGGGGLYHNLVVDTDNNVCAIYATNGVVSGQTQTGTPDEVVFKLNGDTGQCLWVAQQPTFNANGINEYQQIILDKDGQIYVVNMAEGVVSGQTDSGHSEIVVFKLNKNTGQRIWVIQSPVFNTSSYEDLYDAYSEYNLQNMVIDSTGNVYFAYITYGIVSGQEGFAEGSDIVVCKLSQFLLLLEVYTGSQINTIVNYHYVIKNVSHDTITNLQIVDSLGMSVILDQTVLAPNAQTNAHSSYQLTPYDIREGSIHSTATVSGYYGSYLRTAENETTVNLIPIPVPVPTPPLPPRHFHGKIRKCHHKKRYVLKTHWHKSRSNDVCYYEISTRNHKTVIIHRRKLKWRRHIHSHHIHTYRICAVSVNGLRSRYTKLKIRS